MTATPAIRLVLADVDGTLVTPDKALTDRTLEAVRMLRDASILFAITSGRPPRGMQMLIEPLALDTPVAAFDGALLVASDGSVMERKVVPKDLVPAIVSLLASSKLDVWMYRGADWLVRDIHAPHVAREAATVQFSPTHVDNFDGITEGIAKIVGVSDDYDLVASAASAAREKFGDHVSAVRSQAYYVDVTNPDANKGEVADFLAGRYGISQEQIATIGDGLNDIVMFAHSGLSIAMGQSDPVVRRAATRVTTSNGEEGFANAVERFILPVPADPAHLR